MTIAVVAMTVETIVLEAIKLGPELELLIERLHEVQAARVAATRAEQIAATRALGEAALDVIEKAENK